MIRWASEAANGGCSAPVDDCASAATANMTAMTSESTKRMRQVRSERSHHTGDAREFLRKIDASDAKIWQSALMLDSLDYALLNAVQRDDSRTADQLARIVPL